MTGSSTASRPSEVRSTPCAASCLTATAFKPHSLRRTSGFLQVAVLKAPQNQSDPPAQFFLGRFQYSPKTSWEFRLSFDDHCTLADLWGTDSLRKGALLASCFGCRRK